MNSETCPVDGCGRTFERETEQKARSSVISHVSGSTDKSHSGIGYQKAKTLLDLRGASAEPSSESERSAGTETETTSSTTDEPSSSEPSTEPSSRTEVSTRADGGNPALSGPDPDPDTGNESKNDEKDENPGCPHCGTPIAGWGRLNPGKYRCGDCGDPFAKEGATA